MVSLLVLRHIALRNSVLLNLTGLYRTSGCFAIAYREPLLKQEFHCALNRNSNDAVFPVHPSIRIKNFVFLFQVILQIGCGMGLQLWNSGRRKYTTSRKS